MMRSYELVGTSQRSRALNGRAAVDLREDPSTLFWGYDALAGGDWLTMRVIAYLALVRDECCECRSG